MKIGGVTVVFNESNMVKYIMPYYERMQIDKLIVMDNLSTDDTCEQLAKYDFVEIRHFDTNGKFDDRVNSDFKQSVTKELIDEGYDWVYCGDFDEVIWCENDNFKEELEKIEKLGGNVLCRDMIAPFSDVIEDTFDNTKLIHEQRPYYVTEHDFTGKWGFSKVLLRHKSIEEIRLSLGAHECGYPTKGIKSESGKIVMFGYPFYTFHLKWVDWQVLEKNSHDKHTRIQWRLDEPNCTIVDASFTKRLYSRTSGYDNIQKMINRWMQKLNKINIFGWENFKKYYNDNFKVNYHKQAKNKRVTRLDYNNINL